MNTAELFRLLLLRSPGTDRTLVTAAAEHALLVPGGADELLRELIQPHHDLSGETVAQFLKHPDTGIRTHVLLHRNLDPGLRLKAVRAERSTPVLVAVARGSSDPEVLRCLGARKLTVPSATARLCIALLENDALPLGTAAELVCRAEELLREEIAPAETGTLLDVARSAFSTFPSLGAVVVDKIQAPELLLSAARVGDLREEQWEHIEQAMTALLESTSTEAGPNPRVTGWLLDLQRFDRCPEALRVRTAQLVLDRCWGEGSAAAQARAVLARLQPDDAEAAADLAVEQMRQASSTNIDDVRMAIAATVSAQVAQQVALNPVSDVALVLDAWRHMRPEDRDIRAVLALHRSPEERGELCWKLGPDTLAEIPDGEQLEVLDHVIGHVIDTTKAAWSTTTHTMVWTKYLTELSDEVLLSLPWQRVRALGAAMSKFTPRLSPLLAAMLTHPGASRVFAEVETAYTGSSGSLMSAVAASCAPISA